MADDNADPVEEWLTVKEIADELRLTPATVRTWISSGTLAARRAGKRKWLVHRAELDRMLAGENLAGPENLQGRRADEILAPHQSSDWPAEAIAHIGRSSWFQFTSSYWQDALLNSDLAPPDHQFPARIREIAEYMARKANAIANLEGEDPGQRWHQQTGLPGAVLSRELAPTANRPGSAALWQPFDAAVEQLDAAMAQHDLAVEQAALEKLAVVMLDLVEDLTELGYPWPQTTRERRGSTRANPDNPGPTEAAEAS